MYKLKVFKSVVEEFSFELDAEDLANKAKMDDDEFSDYLETKYYYKAEDREPDDWTSEINFIELEQ